MALSKFYLQFENDVEFKAVEKSLSKIAYVTQVFNSSFKLESKFPFSIIYQQIVISFQDAHFILVEEVLNK